MCNVAEASQNADLVSIFYDYPCLKRSDQSYIWMQWQQVWAIAPASPFPTTCPQTVKNPQLRAGWVYL